MKRTMLIVFAACALCLALVGSMAVGGSEDADPWRNLPDSAKAEFLKSGLGDRYRPLADVNPFYLRGEFNGDGRMDHAVRVEDVNTRKAGIAFIHGGGSVVVAGAGNVLGPGLDDLRFHVRWLVQPKGAGNRVEPIYIEKPGCCAGVIYFNGNAYVYKDRGGR